MRPDPIASQELFPPPGAHLPVAHITFPNIELKYDNERVFLHASTSCCIPLFDVALELYVFNMRGL